MVAIPLVPETNAQIFRAPMVEHRGLRLLSELTVFDKYARYLEEERRRESWDEIIERNESMQCRRYPGVADEIRALYRAFVYPKMVLPSMRSLQFAGKPIELMNSRMANCCAAPIDDPRVFREIMFLLLGGTGVGFSVQAAHVNQLPRVTHPVSTRRYVVQDSIVGWADAVDALVKAYLCNRSRPQFIYDDIRPRGARLKTTGGKAPGPEGLRQALEQVEARFRAMPPGHQMRPIEVHDIVCFLAQAVLSGGIRRSAMISLFDFDDDEMIDAKAGQWWVDNAQRSIANNSAVALRHRITRKQFDDYMGRVESNGSGEPGLYFSNDFNSLTNPCFKGDTLVTTRTGVRQIKDLVGQTTEVWDGNRWVSINNFRVTGENQPTLEIELHDGSSVVVTPYHTMILEDGTRVQARHLREGDRLAIGNPEAHGTHREPGAYLKGFLVGDGSTCAGHAVLYLYHAGSKLTCASRLVASANQIPADTTGMRSDTITEPSWRPGKTRDALRGLGARQLTGWATEAKRQFPAEVFGWDPESRAEFIAGVMDADGTANDSANGFSYQITSVHRDWLLGFQTLLKTMGVFGTLGLNHDAGVREMPGGVYECKTTWRLSLPQASSIALARQVKFERLVSFANRECRYNVKPTWNQVEAIRPAAVEPKVYCCTVDSTNSLTIGIGVQTGQCAEASVNQNFCNLTTFNFSVLESQRDLREFAGAAAFLGTLQAGYTDYHYLRPVWQERTEREALLGVSMTGIARSDFERFDLRDAAHHVVATNQRVAGQIGVNPAYRLTVNKPEGTSSAVLQTSSGVHAWHDRHYLRRTRYSADSDLVRHLRRVIPGAVEPDHRDPRLAVVSLPCRAPHNAVTRHEPMEQLLDRIKRCSTDWVREGHRKGHNGHSVSATVSVKPGAWGELRDWMWAHRHAYNGIAVLPYDGGTYDQAPFESISAADYYDMANRLPETLGLDRITEGTDDTAHTQEVACAGGACVI